MLCAASHPPSYAKILLCCALITAPCAHAHDATSTRAAITMKAVMAPSASLRIQTQTKGFEVSCASVQLPISSQLPKSSSSPIPLNCTVQPKLPRTAAAVQSSPCNIHSSVTWGMATFTLEAF